MAKTKQLQFRSKPKRRWDLLAAAALILSVAGKVVPIADRDRFELVANNVVELCSSLKGAVERHLEDTGRYPVADSKADSAAAQQLFDPQSYAGWKGPYCKSRLSVRDHPLGHSMILMDRNEGLWGRGFPLNSRDSSDRNPGAASVLILRGIPERVAIEVDQILDRNNKNGSELWDRSGTVEYRSGSLAILIGPN
jgi:hypothetical protein